MLSLIVAALSISGLTLPLTIWIKALLLLDWWQGRLRLIQVNLDVRKVTA